jgi:hypothetical protein
MRLSRPAGGLAPKDQFWVLVERKSDYGRVVKTYVQEGTYYSEALSEGFDPAGPNDSQGYITELAARALVFIEADNPRIGLMCVMPVSMAEVSSCQITVYEGKQSDRLSWQVDLDFDLHGQTPGLDSNNIPAKSRIATGTQASQPAPQFPQNPRSGENFGGELRSPCRRQDRRRYQAQNVKRSWMETLRL